MTNETSYSLSLLPVPLSPVSPRVRGPHRSKLERKHCGIIRGRCVLSLFSFADPLQEADDLSFRAGDTIIVDEEGEVGLVDTSV